MKWEYYVDGIKQTFWRRIYPTKTFKAMGLCTLGAVLGALNGVIGWRTAITAAAIGSAIILVKAGMTKLELGSAALNSDLPNVTAKSKK